MLGRWRPCSDHRRCHRRSSGAISSSATIASVSAVCQERASWDNSRSRSVLTRDVSTVGQAVSWFRT